MRAYDRGEVIGRPAGIQGVDTRDDRNTRVCELRQVACDRIASVLLLGCGNRVFHVRDERVGSEAERLVQHVVLVARYEEQAA